MPSALLSAVDPARRQGPARHARPRPAASSGGSRPSAPPARSSACSRTGFILVAEFPTTPVVITLGLPARRRRRRPVVPPRPAPARAGRRRRRRRSACWRRASPSPPRRRATSRPPTSAPRVEADDDRPSGRLLVLDDLRHAYVDLDDPTYLEFTLHPAARRRRRRRPPRRASRSTPSTSAAAASRSPATSRPPGPAPTASCSSSTPASSTSPRTSSGSGVGPTLRVRHRRRPGQPARRPRRQRRPRRRRRLRRTCRAVAPDDDRVRRATSAGSLRDDGIYAQNVIDQPPLGFLRADVATLREVFEHVAVLGPAGRFDGSEGGNTIVVASDAPLPLAAIAAAQRSARRRRRSSSATRPPSTTFIGRRPGPHRRARARRPAADVIRGQAVAMRASPPIGSADVSMP